MSFVCLSDVQNTCGMSTGPASIYANCRSNNLNIVEKRTSEESAVTCPTLQRKRNSYCSNDTNWLNFRPISETKKKKIRKLYKYFLTNQKRPHSKPLRHYINRHQFDSFGHLQPFAGPSIILTGYSPKAPTH